MSAYNLHYGPGCDVSTTLGSRGIRQLLHLELHPWSIVLTVTKIHMYSWYSYLLLQPVTTSWRHIIWPSLSVYAATSLLKQLRFVRIILLSTSSIFLEAAVVSIILTDPRLHGYLVGNIHRCMAGNRHATWPQSLFCDYFLGNRSK